MQISYTELEKQPSWWVHHFIYYLQGKGKAEAQKSKDAERRSMSGRKR